MLKMRRLEKFIHFCMLLLLMGVFIPLYQQMVGADVNKAEGDPLTRVVLLCGYLITVSILMLYPRRTARVALHSTLPWLLMSLALISFLWSYLPAVTLRRSIAILLTTLYGITLVMRFNFDELLDLLGYALLTSLFFGLIFILFLPDWGRMIYSGELAWRGVFIHKNELGLYCAFSLLVFGTLWRKSPRQRDRLIWAIGFVLAIVLLVRSRSVSGLVLATLILLGSVLLYFLFSLRRIWQIVLPVVLLVGGSVLVLITENYQTLLAFLGRGQSLTGRIPLWEFLIPMALKRPWLGYGFGAFWSGWNGPSALVWQAIPYWQPFQAHNGYLDIFLDLGFLGFLVMIALMVRLLYLAFHRFRDNFFEGQFWILFFSFMIILNLNESFLARQNNIFWVLVIYAFISINAQTKASKIER